MQGAGCRVQGAGCRVQGVGCEEGLAPGRVRPRAARARLVWCGGCEYLRLIDSCITQLEAQGPSRTCNESKEEGEEGGCQVRGLGFRVSGFGSGGKSLRCSV